MRLSLSVIAAAALFTSSSGCGDDKSPRSLVDPGNVVMVAVPTNPHRFGAQRSEQGTGWVYSAPKGLIVTAFHVVNGAPFAQVNLARRDARPAIIVAASPCDDVAVLRVDNTRGLTTMRLGDDASLSLGQRLTTVGFPAANGTRRQVSVVGSLDAANATFTPTRSERQYAPLRDVLEVTNAIRGGQSGSPIVDASGRVAAMAVQAWFARKSGKEAWTQGIGADRLKAVLKTLASGRSPGWVGTGLDFPALRPQDAPPGTGAVVAGLPGVTGGYPRSGVLVTAVNGKPVGDSFASWCQAVAPLRPGPADVTLVKRPGAGSITLRFAANGSRMRDHVSDYFRRVANTGRPVNP